VLRIFAAVACFLLWLKFFSYLRIFNKFSSFIRMIMEMFKDMSIFLAMLLLGILSFANTYYVLDQITYDEIKAQDEKDFVNVTGGSAWDSIMYTYRMGLGDFDTDPYNDSNYMPLYWALFISCTVFIQILLLNLLIAIMGDTFERVQEMKEQAQLRECCSLIADNWFLLDREKKFASAKYIVVASLEKAAGQNKGNWDGKLAAIKDTFERASKNIESNIQKVRDSGKAELESVARRIEGQFLTSENQIKGFQATIQNQIKDLQTSHSAFASEIEGYLKKQKGETKEEDGQGEEDKKKKKKKKKKNKEEKEE